MEKEFVSYDQALILKELGFDEPCFGYYADKTGEDKTIYTVGTSQSAITDMSIHTNHSCPSYQFSAPLKQQVFRWFRDKHKLVFYVNMVTITIFYYVIDIYPSDTYKTYEEAEDACIDKLIEIVKQK